MNPSQEELVRTLGNKCAVFVVGDPRQTIYQWRGSDAECFERFLSHFNAMDIRVPENRRSLKDIVDCANHFSQFFEKTINEPMREVRKEKGGVFYLHFDNAREEATWIAEQIQKLIESGFKYSDIAVLYRSVMHMAKPLIEEFEKRNIPYTVLGSTGLFERKEAQAMRYLFSWLWDECYVKVGRKTLKDDELLTKGIELWKKATGLEADIDRLKEWKRKVQGNEYDGFIEVYQDLLERLGFKELDEGAPNVKVIKANLGRFSELLTDFEVVYRLGGGWKGVRNYLSSLFFYIQTYALDSYEELKPEIFSQLDAVSIATVHQSKGLEWSVVFLPCLNDGYFPSKRVGNEQKWDIPRDLFDAERYEGELEDERRLFYVAITRARDYLVLSSSSKEPSRFVENIKGKYTRICKDKYLDIRRVSQGSDRTVEVFLPVSSVVAYSMCPKLFEFRELYGYKPQINEEIYYGKSIHYCLQQVVEELKRTDCKKESELRDLVSRVVEKKFYLPFASREQNASMKEAVKKIIYNYVLQNCDTLKRSVTSEFRIDLYLGNSNSKVVLSGRADMVQEEDGAVCVIEYKVSDQVADEEHAKLQLSAYCKALAEAGKKVRSARLVYLNHFPQGVVELTQEEMQTYGEKLKECVTRIVSESFNPQEKNHCPRCDYKKICKHSSVC